MLDHAIGLPVLHRRPSYVHAIANIPAESPSAGVARFLGYCSLPRKLGRVGFRITLFETCSAFTHVTACTLAKSPKVTLTPKASVAYPSATAPIATGWSDSCRVGFAPTGTPCLSTAHELAGLVTLLS